MWTISLDDTIVRLATIKPFQLLLCLQYSAQRKTLRHPVQYVFQPDIKKNPISLTFMSKAEAILETRNVSSLSASMYCMAALAAALA